MDLCRKSVPGRRDSQSKGSEVGRYLACLRAGRSVWLEGRDPNGQWEAVRTEGPGRAEPRRLQ